MRGKDLVLSLAAGIITAIFIGPSLKGLGLSDKLPLPDYQIGLVYIVLAVVGTQVANFIGKKIAILWQLAKFSLVGVLNTAIDFGILNYLSILTGITGGTRVIPLNVLSFSVAVLNSYWWNKNWVFEGKKKANFVSFLIVSAIGIAINTGVVFAISTFIPAPSGISSGLWLNLGKILATVLSLAWNFLGYRLVVFKH
jgi:putative flippase GtrA